MKTEKVIHDDGETYVVEYTIDDDRNVAVHDIIKYRTGEIVTSEWFDKRIIHSFDVYRFAPTEKEQFESDFDRLFS